MRRNQHVALVAALGLGASFCGTDDDPPPATTNFTIQLQLSGLETLSEGAYEGWLIYGSEKVSTGTFTDPSNARMTSSRNPNEADQFVLSIEPTPDNDPEPAIVVLAGDVQGSTVDLAFPADLSGVAGGYILRTPTDDATNLEHVIDLTATGLEDLTEGAYEGWLIFGDEKVSTGTFTTGAGATMVTRRDPAEADELVITIEPTPDNDPEPSGIVVLAGAISGESVDLTFPVDLSGASGSFILRTPTDDATNANNDEAGLWFLQMGPSGPEAALELPALPEGWVYEGWGVTQGMPLTTGRFTSASGADQASPFSEGGPPFPGEDFVMNLPAGITPPVNLADGNSLAVISVEPDLEGSDPTGPGPFALKPLAHMIAAGAPNATPIALEAGPVVTVTGTAQLSSRPFDNDNAGVWFLEMGSNGPMAGLTLPTLPDGWVYEGWAVTQSTPLTTGRFTSAEGVDQASPFSEGGPPFPGEDFLTELPAGITPPVDLTDGSSMVVLSVEPDIDGADPTGAGPFALKPLAGAVPTDLEGGVYTLLGEGPVTDLSGTATFSN